MLISTWVIDVMGLTASTQRFTTYRSRGCQRPTFGELGGTRKMAELVMGTTTAFSHSFQKLAKLPSRPRMPYARGIQNPVSPSVNPSILDAAPWRTGRSKSAINPIFSSTALISSSSASRSSESEGVPGNFAKSLLSFALSVDKRSPRLLASSRSSWFILALRHASHCLSSSSEASAFSAVHMITTTPCILAPSPPVIAKPCHVDLGRSSDDTTVTSFGNANIGTYSGNGARRLDSSVYAGEG
jgi:hypothetical protein